MKPESDLYLLEDNTKTKFSLDFPVGFEYSREILRKSALT